jgi:ATP-dependent Clp protease adapter protein ClpS
MSPRVLEAIAVLGGVFVVLPILFFFGLRYLVRRFVRGPASFPLGQKLTWAGYVFYASQVIFIFGCVFAYQFDQTSIGETLHTLPGFFGAVLIAFLGFYFAEILIRRTGYPLVQVQLGIILPQDTSLLKLEGFVPSGFACGIEILNDNTTPMVFVVSALGKYAGLDRRTSMQTMIQIHNKGGILLPLESYELANRVAASIVADARMNSHKLVCRAVSV